MKKLFLVLLFFVIVSGIGFAQNSVNDHVIIEITNVVINGGKVRGLIFSNAEELEKVEPCMAFELEADRTVLNHRVSLAYGEYYVSAYQDTNGNGELDFGLFRRPKEPVGISNYFGKGFPSDNFEKQKVPVDGTTDKILIGLYKF